MRPHVAIGLGVLIPGRPGRAGVGRHEGARGSRRRCDARSERCARRRYLRFGRILWHLRGYLDNGFLFRLSISGTHRRDTQREELGLEPSASRSRTDLNVSTFRSDTCSFGRRSARPFVHAGVSASNAQDIEANVEFLDR